MIESVDLTVGAFLFHLGSGVTWCELGCVAIVPDFTFDLLAYGVLVLGGFGFLWLYYDQRDRQFYDSERRKITFHCIRCDHIYTKKSGTDLAQCPRCNHLNTRLKF